MKYLAMFCLCVLLSSCAYISSTVATMKARDVNAIASGVPIGVEDGDVLLKRTMSIHIFHDCKDVEEK